MIGAGAAIGAAGGVLNGITGMITGAMNHNLQKEQFQYQKQLQERMFEREDNAAQRKATDLAKAGLSKTLAAGAGANAGPVVQTQAPQIDIPPADLGAFNQGYGNDIKDSAQKAQARLIDEQMKTHQTERDFVSAQADKQRADTLATIYETRMNMNSGIRRGDKDPISRGVGIFTRGLARVANKDMPGTKEAQALDYILQRIESKLGGLK